MSKPKMPSSPFQLDGRFIGVILSRVGTVKGIRLKTADGEQVIKLAKPLRTQVDGLLPGDWIEVKGKQKLKQRTGRWKHNANALQVLNPERSTPFSSDSPSTTQSQPKAKVLLCKKSGCMKRGGKSLCEALESGLRDRGLEEQVTIQMTGCMKQCKAGPNLVAMPEKKIYRCVSPDDVPNLLDQLFSTSATYSYSPKRKGNAAIASPSYP